MTVLLKILLSLLIFCGGVWLTATLIVDNAGERPIGGFAGLVIFPSTIAGIIAVWRYTPKKRDTSNVYEEPESSLCVDLYEDFVNYYELLQLNTNFSEKQIKEAYRTQAVKWHPDKNPDLDTTVRMQQINEAYILLSDTNSRKLYEQEYLRYQKFCKQKKRQDRPKLEYAVQDETLKNRIFKARQQAAKLAKQSLQDTVAMTLASGKAIISQAFVRAVFFIGIVLIFTMLSKACN